VTLDLTGYGSRKHRLMNALLRSGGELSHYIHGPVLSCAGEPPCSCNGAVYIYILKIFARHKINTTVCNKIIVASIGADACLCLSGHHNLGCDRSRRDRTVHRRTVRHQQQRPRQRTGFARGAKETTTACGGTKGKRTHRRGSYGGV
jgi:hypothetical protein